MIGQLAWVIVAADGVLYILEPEQISG